MKHTFLKVVVLVFAFILTIGCSPETDNTQEQELIITNRFGDQTNDTEIICINNNLDTEGYGINTIFIQFKPGLTREEKQAIRAPYCGNMISIEPCDRDPINGEIWTVRGPCQTSGPNPIVCQPGIIPPADPDLRQSVLSNGCYNPDPADPGEFPHPINGN